MHPTLQGILCAFIGIAAMSVMDAFIKIQALDLPVNQVLFFRGLIGLPVVIAIAAARGGLAQLKTQKPKLHIVRAVLAVGAFSFFTFAVQHLSLANAITIAFVSPLFTALLTMLLLEDRVGRHRMVAIFVGFGGVIIAMRPDGGIVSWPALAVVVCAFCFALSNILARKEGKSESALCMTFWMTFGMATFSAPTLVFSWADMGTTHLWIFAAMAIFGGIAMSLITQAVRIAPPVVVAPLEYTSILWAVGFDYWIWQVTPDLQTLVGCTVIVGAGIYVLARERHHKGDEAGKDISRPAREGGPV